MLLDSNIIIYAAEPEYQSVRDFIAKHDSIVSVISKIEVMGYHQLTSSNLKMLELLFQSLKILPLSDGIVDKAISLRQQKKMSLGDSLIAATAIIHSSNLITANTKDFDWIEELTVINPIENSKT